jgi:hypothetical protein
MRHVPSGGSRDPILPLAARNNLEHVVRQRPLQFESLVRVSRKPNVRPLPASSK